MNEKSRFRNQIVMETRWCSAGGVVGSRLGWLLHCSTVPLYPGVLINMAGGNPAMDHKLLVASIPATEIG